MLGARFIVPLFVFLERWKVRDKIRDLSCYHVASAISASPRTPVISVESSQECRFPRVEKGFRRHGYAYEYIL